MIQQSNQQPIQQSIQQPICDSASQCSGNGAEYSWLGHGVAISKAFVKSLIPMEDPCLSFNSRKAVKDLLRLATTTIVPSSSILFMAKDMANAWSGSGLPGPDAKPELPQTSKETRGEAQEKETGSKDVPLQQPSTARYQGSQGTKGLLALGTLASSFQYANSKQIKNAEDLGKIGRDPEFPPNGKYQQTADIVVNKDHKPIGTFTGDYDGQCNTISGLSACFVDTLEGSIRNLRFTGANITSQKTTGLAACVVDDTGTVSNIRAKDVHILTNGHKSYAGIGGGEVKGTVGNTTAVNSHVKTTGQEANAGIGGGLVKGTVGNTTAVNSTVETNGYFAYAGIGGGMVSEGTVANTTAVNSTVETNGYFAYAGIGGGLVYFKGTVGNTTAVNSTVETNGYYAHAGIGGGMVSEGTVADTTAVNSRVHTRFTAAGAGIGGGMVSGGTVDNTMAVNSRVDAATLERAGIGGGWVPNSDWVTNTKAVNSFVNGKKKNFGSIPNDQLFCQKADLRVLAANCSIRTEFQDSGFSYNDACPGNGTTASTDATVSTTASASTTAKESTPTTASTPIKINDTETLGKIGRHPDYPLDGTYQQTADIVVTKDYQSIGNDTHPFTGEYDGQRRTISGLSDCLVDTLKQGNISRLGFTDTHINSTKTTGVAACTANGTVSDIRAENVHISTSGDNAYAGIGAGLVGGGGMVTNTTAVNSTVETSGENALAGIGGGGVFGTVANTSAVNSRVETSGENAHAGIGGGSVFGTVANTTAVNSTVETSGTNALAGIGGGIVWDEGTVANTTAVNSRVETSGENALAGIGGGIVWVEGTVANTTAVNSMVETSGTNADAGIGGGDVRGMVAHTKAVNSTVKTSGTAADAGIGGGRFRNGCQHHGGDEQHGRNLGYPGTRRHRGGDCLGRRNGCQHHGGEQHGRNLG
ncbi:hypothetical protein [Endozoicomonas sp. ALB091]|uniref:hypothetical protein n=2 Tax=unclassified Endozoicomonas TaxID=2644528 RepID=UPI003BB7549F